MYKKFLLLLILPFILVACGDDDEPQNGIFEMVVTEAPQDTETSVKDTECGISTNGEAQTIVMTLLGDYDSFRVTGTIPDWIYTTSSTNVLKFKLSEYIGDELDVRSAEITFIVYKGNQSVNGRIIIHQYAIERTYEYLKKLESQAIDFYLKDFEVVDKLPQISEIKAGESAPYYKLDSDGNVYMQVVKMGSASAATQGERIYFRFLRYNLMTYYEYGEMPIGEGNAMDPNQGIVYFDLGSDKAASSHWGTAVQMPLLLGIPFDSVVNLVVASNAGPTAEIANVIPFLYNIRYYPAAMKFSNVRITFTTAIPNSKND